MNQATKELKNTTYELFVGVLSLLSIVNLAIITFASDHDVRNVAAVMDNLLSAIFLIDFGYRLLSAESKRAYFLRQYGWADLLASVPAPQFKLLRLFRIWRAGRLMRRYGTRRLVKQFLQDRAESALFTVLFLIILVLEFGGMGVVSAERESPDANIKNASDALWWAYVSITTVGYGDRFPVTNAGRLWGVLVLAAGVGLFGVLTGFLANSFLASQQPADEASGNNAMPAAAESAADLGELKQILAEHRQAQIDIQERLATIERMLMAANQVARREPEQSDAENRAKSVPE